MNREEIIDRISGYISQSLDGQTIEVSKFDYKKQWPNLNTKSGISEFLKDTSAMANTFGPDGFIVYGFDDKTATLHECSFKDSGLPDTSHIIGIINKGIDRLFHLDVIDAEVHGTKLSIVHIPPSFDKPHVITNYKRFDKEGNLKSDEQHKIFVRKVSGTQPASKYDLELMYWDRKNVQLEYELHCSFHRLSFNVHIDRRETEIANCQISINLILENLGRRPFAATDIKFDLGMETIIRLESRGHKVHPIILKPGDMEKVKVTFDVENFPPGTNSTIVSVITANLKSDLCKLSHKSMILKNTLGKEVSAAVTIME